MAFGDALAFPDIYDLGVPNLGLSIFYDQLNRLPDVWAERTYLPWEDIPQGCSTFQVPGGLWALFRCVGALPDSLQKVNTQIWSEWLPALKGYALAGDYSLEFYMPPAKDPADTVSYICVPLKKI